VSLTWPLRTQSGLSVRAMPTGCIFSHKGPDAFVEGDAPQTLLTLLAVTNLVEADLLARSGVGKGAFYERGRKM
jgi:hypothetical protein